MSEISYFQQYAQKENHVTNNTLLMFRHLYKHSLSKFKTFLIEIADQNEFEIGVTFKQQEREISSIPDATIVQKPINIYIETKLDGSLCLDQIARHVEGAEDAGAGENTYIIALSKHLLTASEKTSLNKLFAGKSVKFAHKTFNQLIDILEGLTDKHEVDLEEIIEDYRLFLGNINMLPNKYEMVVFPCGTSWNENIEYSLYYEQASKSSKAHASFLGIYKDKKITHFGRLRATAVCYLKNNELASRRAL